MSSNLSHNHAPSPPIHEEIANSLTHALGVALGIAMLVLLVVFANRYGDTWHVVSCSIFGSAIILLYLVSTLYHSVRDPKWKRLFKILDHCCIYIMIAGTYTPFVLVNMRGPWGWSLFGILWGITICGIVFKIFFVYRFKGVSTLCYLAMGWMIVVALKPALESIASGGLLLIAYGGAAYTVGTVFYYWDHRIPFGHAVWHLCVLTGTIFHFFAVLFYVIPLHTQWVVLH